MSHTVNDTPVQLHITFRGLRPTATAEHAIRDRVSALSGPRGRVVRVIVACEPHRRRRLEAACRAQLVLALPNGKRLSVRGRVRGHATTAIAEVFSVARRCLRQRPVPVRALDLAS